MPSPFPGMDPYLERDAICWDEGPYPELLHYHDLPTGVLAPDDITWCRQLVGKPTG